MRSTSDSSEGPWTWERAVVARRPSDPGRPGIACLPARRWRSAHQSTTRESLEQRVDLALELRLIRIELVTQSGDKFIRGTRVLEQLPDSGARPVQLEDAVV